MLFAQKANERSKIIRGLNRVQNSVFYPIVFAALCIFAGLNDKTVYLPIMWTMCGLLILSVLFSADNKVLLVPMLMSYYSLGSDSEKLEFIDTDKIYLQSFDQEAFKQIVLCGVIMVLAVVVRLIADGSIARAFKKRGICTFSILLLDAALLMNGIFSSGYSALNLGYGALLATAITVVYFLVLAMLDRSENAIPYACKTLVCTSYVALIQCSVSALKMHKEGNLFRYNEALEIIGINRQTLSWGVATIIGAVIVIGIPAAMYLAKNCKYSFVSYASALLFLCGAVLVDTRSALIVGSVFFVLCALISCVNGKNRWFNRAYTLVLIAAICVALIYVNNKIIPLNEFFDKIRNILRFEDLESDGRIPLFKNGIEDFKSSWLFGVGFNNGGYAADVVKNNVYSKMYHNIVIQFLGSMGVVGIAAFLIHLKQLGEVAVRRFSLDKLLLIFVPLMTICMSMADNFFFYANFQIIYSVFLAISEISLERTRKKRLLGHRTAEEGKKPRVAFTYVEAGKGHIVPEAAVQKSFEEKYGDKVEIIESSFYNETGDKKLKKTETLFIKTVKNQNKSFVAGMMCRIGTWFCGDTLSLSWVMACTPSGIGSYKRAKKHLSELDCDVLFTTHWSVAYYASHMKNAPYTVMLCPDPYSNGMFNVDVNNFLMTSEAGKKQAERKRMYAGGNVNAVPPPIRQGAKKYLGGREELRKKHGISEDSFTVVLLDGGYGMARLEATVKYLLKSKSDITIIALCGTNDGLKELLDKLKTPEKVKLLSVAYSEDVFEYIALSDLFCGKAGANSLAEAAYFGVPIMVTKCITYIERHNKNYYTKKVKGAMYVPSAYLAAKKIMKFANDPSLLEPYKKNISKLYGVSGEETVADIIYEAAKNI